jgi:hypothetical protein
MRKNRTTSSLSRNPALSGQPLWPENKGVPSGAGKRPVFPEKQGDPFTDITGPSPKGIRDPGSSRRCHGGTVPAYTLPFRWPAMSSAATDDGSGTKPAKGPLNHREPRPATRSRHGSAPATAKTRPGQFSGLIPGTRKMSRAKARSRRFTPKQQRGNVEAVG